jgi:hypothetical protein
MGGDADQDVLQVIERRDVRQPATLDQRVQEGGALGPREAAREEPVLAAERNRAELVLGTGMPRPRLCRVDARTRGDVRDRDCTAWADAA